MMKNRRETCGALIHFLPSFAVRVSVCFVFQFEALNLNFLYHLSVSIWAVLNDLPLMQLHLSLFNLLSRHLHFLAFYISVIFTPCSLISPSFHFKARQTLPWQRQKQTKFSTDWLGEIVKSRTQDFDPYCIRLESMNGASFGWLTISKTHNLP